jgi:hypothetical protein
MRERAALGGSLSEGKPRPGSGYREEIIPQEIPGEVVVVREREPKSNIYPPAKTHRELVAEQAVRDGAERARMLEEKERERKARQLAYELLEDESKWWPL